MERLSHFPLSNLKSLKFLIWFLARPKEIFACHWVLNTLNPLLGAEDKAKKTFVTVKSLQIERFLNQAYIQIF